MNKIKYFFVAALLMIVIGNVYSQTLSKTGTTAAQFLKIPIGPRAIGMGGAFTATANDISAIYWNPAGLASGNTGEAGFNHINWFADIDYDFAGVATYIDGIGTIGAFVSVLSTEDMIVRTLENPEGTGEYFSFGDLAIGISYARNLTDNFSIGFNAKYIREHIWHMSAVGFAIDIGVLYKIPILNEFRLAACVSNFGTKMQLDGRDILLIYQSGAGDGNLINTKVELDSWDLPLLFRVGIAADIVKDNTHRLTTAIDAVHPNDNTESLNFGLEYAWNDIFFVRGGYNAAFERDTEKGFTVGAGLKYRIISSIYAKVDYAYQDHGRLTAGDFNDVHYFSLGIQF
ncbi:MAG: PorV/PorQ family protein [Ignavibacteriales bacterium]|nr:PorV/PorQ family protein [Ignavibacteriales bacterium]